MKAKNKNTRTRCIALAAAAALVLMLLTACKSAASADDGQSASADSSAASETAASAEAGSNAAFVFSDSGIRASADDDSYEINGTALTIRSSGTYTLEGDCSDGSVTVEKGTTGVTLVLNGLTLTSADTAPITCGKSSQVVIEAAANTVSTLTDCAENNDEVYPNNENAENAVIKCKDGSQVSICGAGVLNINANGKNGIKSGATTAEAGEASLTIREAELNITVSVNDAINAEQQLDIESGTLTLSAADDAIHSDLVLNIGSSGTEGPTIRIEESCEGMEAAELNINSGMIDIISTDDCLNAANSDLANYAFSMNISGGTIHAYSSGGDGFDSNGSMTISGGTVSVWTANIADNQPLDADSAVTISGGTVLAAGGSSGMGMNLSTTQSYVSFGASGGMGGRQPGGMGGQMPGGMGGRQSDDMGDRKPDGMGDQQPDDIGNQQPDGMGDQQFGGGMGFGLQGGENAVSVSANSTFSIQDDSGNVLYSGTAACQANYVFFTSAELTSDSGYTLTVDGTSLAEATAQVGTGDAQAGFGSQPTGENGDAPGGELGMMPGNLPGEAPDDKGGSAGGDGSGSTGG